MHDQQRHPYERISAFAGFYAMLRAETRSLGIKLYLELYDILGKISRKNEYEYAK
jgi:hypothetical protein